MASRLANRRCGWVAATVRGTLGILTLAGLVLGSVPASAQESAAYFPPPDSEGGWRTPGDPTALRQMAGVDSAKLDKAFEYIKTTSKNGGLLVARRGWLVYEKYFGRAHHEATANTASCGKSFTSIAMGILLGERPELFPDGLDQQVFTPKYLPPAAFPLSDPRKAQIKLGQLLAMTAGIRGNNPGIVNGKELMLDPAGPDGWIAMDDAMALGNTSGKANALTLWCDPGGGYSYATSSIHIVSIILRHLTGGELRDYVDQKLARPMGWQRWGWGYQNRPLAHTPGGGGIAPRPADMLRFAYLLLREGRWEKRQLVPADYVRKAGRSSPYNPHFPYSLQFHVNQESHAAGIPSDAFWKPGSGGHCIYVVPSLDLVVFKMGGRDEQYDPQNTGVPPVPESVFRYDGSRDDWKRAAAGEDEWEQTLRLIVSAMVKE